MSRLQSNCAKTCQKNCLSSCLFIFFDLHRRYFHDHLFTKYELYDRGERNIVLSDTETALLKADFTYQSDDKTKNFILQRLKWKALNYLEQRKKRGANLGDTVANTSKGFEDVFYTVGPNKKFERSDKELALKERIANECFVYLWEIYKGGLRTPLSKSKRDYNAKIRKVIKHIENDPDFAIGLRLHLCWKVSELKVESFDEMLKTLEECMYIEVRVR